MRINDIFEKYENEKDLIDVSIEDLKADIGDCLDKIVLYGAGSAGIAFLHYLNDAGIFPRFFSDGDSDKQGKYCEGLKIIPPSQITLELGKDALVIVTINTDGNSYCRDFKEELLKGGHQGVHQALKNCGCEKVIDYTYFRRCFRLFKGGRYNLPAAADVYLMYEHKQDLISVYDFLEDDISREIYSGILQYRMLVQNANIPTISESKQYFEYEIFPKKDDEILVDCGACGGSSLSIFLSECNSRFDKYYGVEPDKANFERLKTYVNSFSDEIQKKMHIINAAAYSHDGEETFFVLNGPGTFASECGPDEVPCMKIDTILNGEPVTYIKMNIEGSEIPALMGAEASIKKYKPRLAIMGYHKTSDMWEVPLLMKQYRPDYKIYLRSYMKNVAFCYFAC